MKGMVNVVIGASGSNKTTWVMQMINAMATGEPFFDMEPAPLPRTHYIALDRRQIELEVKMEKLNLPKNVFTYESFASQLAELDGLKHLLKMHVPEGTKLLIIDGIGFVVNRIISQRDVGIVMSHCNKFCEEHDATIVIIHHTAKSKQGQGYVNPREKGLGSGAWVQMAGVAVLLEQTDSTNIEDPGRIAYIMQNSRHGKAISLTVNENGLLEKDGSKHLDILRSLNEEFSVADILIHGVSQSTAYNYLQEWIEKGFATRLKQGKYRRLFIN